MQNIIGLFQRVKRQIVINVLYVVVIKIISIDIGKPDGIGPALGKKVLDNIKQPAYNYSTLASMDSDLPAANKEPPLNYIDLLKKAQELGKPIKPIKHRKSISKSIECPCCSAPYKYIYSNAVVAAKHRKKKVQKYKCKICSHQWFPNRLKKHAVFSCPLDRKSVV